jgi:amino acid transporter
MDIEKRPIQSNNGEQDVPDDRGDTVNVSGHVQELDRSFSVWSICCIGIMNNNAWASGGGSLVIALYNGGGPGVLYGLMAATFFYAFIGLSLAELASAIPSSANVYHWASVTAGPKYGRVCSWFGGWWNSLAWIFGTSSVCLFGANAALAMYSLYHPDYVPERWHIFFAFLGIAWFDNLLVMFGQRFLAKVANASGMLCIAFLVITVMVCAIMPSKTGAGYATSASVWMEFTNLTGYSSSGFVFLAGMLNGAYAIGTVDGVCHLCEEIPNPRINVPKGIAAQLGAGFLTTFFFFVAIVSRIFRRNPIDLQTDQNHSSTASPPSTTSSTPTSSPSHWQQCTSKPPAVTQVPWASSSSSFSTSSSPSQAPTLSAAVCSGLWLVTTQPLLRAGCAMSRLAGGILCMLK